MGNFSNTFSSSLGKKLVMSLTGLFMCSFLVVHLVGNLQLFKHDGGLAFNTYAYFMTHFPPIKVVSYLLYTSIVLHAIYALVLTMKNKKARPIGYAVTNGKANSPWTSRNMGILGTVLLVFIIIHMNTFWAKYHWGGVPYKKYVIELQNPEHVQVTDLPISSVEPVHTDAVDLQSGSRVVIAKDLYLIVQNAFESPLYVAFYVLAMAALSFHLIHGFRSAFQTLGWDHKKYIPLIRFIGVWGFGLLIPIVFAAMPLFFLFKTFS
ncbi:succinate dehydrogenase cytochrome b subunit [Hufsiella ginkgonis]|uniref:Succinate dehydrogenase n=1 Tax=Hufsiella ginkgonis TaxID=2695274 RepID=A0A7K1XTU3_9SPHI|nr:succinate dehydrogenase cytochrome b subunit [Hufsiella ginkgonis]MXV14425.1 succinate dehydrogenase [Hufsiella ginkgonis]